MPAASVLQPIKVFKHHNDWWEEFRLYHRKDGKVVKEGDDLMCATRYALMMLRFAQTIRAHHNVRGKFNYPKRGWMKDNLRPGIRCGASTAIILGVSPMAWSSFALPTATKPRRSAVHRLTISLEFWRENSVHSLSATIAKRTIPRGYVTARGQRLLG